VVVEDSEAGLLAATAAGMYALHYAPDGMTPSNKACASFSDMRELLELVRAIANAA
jgi:beta-phosphoglucomutase-like phosphatase (HAD superfamily)